MTHGDLQHARELVGNADELRIDAALAEQLPRVGLLEVAAADLLPRNVGGEGEYGDATAVGVEQPVDQVEVPRPAARRTDGELAGDGRLAGGRERGRLLVAHVHPVDPAVAPQRVREAVERVAWQAVDAPHPACLQRGDDRVGGRHGSTRKAAAVPRPYTRCAPRSLPSVSRSYSQIGR